MICKQKGGHPPPLHPAPPHSPILPFPVEIKQISMFRDKRDQLKKLEHAIFATADSIVYKYCSTRPISKHLYSGIFKDLLDT